MQITAIKSFVYPVWLVLAFTCFGLAAQGQAVHSSFTAKDGLPSNLVYRCVEDNRGFLWVATDAGIARFDGKYFQVFTTAHGLPDNEVLAVLKAKDGRIWVNCFKQSPAYFDERSNRFVNASTDSNLAKVTGTVAMHMFSLADGGVMYQNESGSFVFKNNRLTSFPSGFLVHQKKDGSFIYWGGLKTKTSTGVRTAAIYHASKQGILDSLVLKNVVALPFLNEDAFYLFSSPARKFYVFRELDNVFSKFRVDSVTVPETFITYDFTPTTLYLLGSSGKMYVYDKNTLQMIKTVGGGYLSNSYYKDSKGNEWVSTIDKGLLVYRPNRFAFAPMGEGFHRTNFISVARKKDGTILAGNYYGEVVESAPGKFRVHKVIKTVPSRLRKIVVVGEQVFTISEQGIFVDYTRPVLDPKSGIPQTGKTATYMNDTSLLVGFSAGMLTLNPYTKKFRRLSVKGKRLTAIARKNDSLVYFGSTDGLYEYNLAADEAIALSGHGGIGHDRVTALANTGDELLWVGTGGQGLAVCLENTRLRTITASDGILDNSIRCLAAGRPGTIWVGTSRGVSIISYQLKGNRFTWNARNVSANDGLTNNEVNDMWFDNDTMYLATGNGVSIVPANLSIPALNISLQLTGMTAGGKELDLLNTYHLEPDQKNVTIRFAGVDLGGYFSRLQYRLGESATWINSEENTLNLQLSHGDHVLYARAVDINGHPSDRIFMVDLRVATPFWKTIWFLVLAIAILQIVVLYVGIRWVKNRRRIRVAQNLAGVQVASLEQQAFTSLMNPHFIFNALNSIQHYINLQDRQSANRYLSDFASLIRKNFDAAQRSFVTLEEELESARIYLRLEQMRFKNKFSFTVNLHEDVDPDQWMVPTLMMQPLLENAILHGIMPSSLPGSLVLDIWREKQNLHVTITDNGIGMENSRRRKSGNHKSGSMELIRKRVSALNRFVSMPISINFSVACDDPDNPGNKTTIIIPSGLYRAWQKAQEPARASSIS